MQQTSDQTLREFRFSGNCCNNIFELGANLFPQQLVLSEQHASNKHLLELVVLNDNGRGLWHPVYNRVHKVKQVAHDFNLTVEILVQFLQQILVFIAVIVIFIDLLLDRSISFVALNHKFVAVLSLLCIRDPFLNQLK